jgi:integrase
MARKTVKKKRQYGSGSVFRRGGGTWRIKWREGGRTRYKSGFVSEDQARQSLAVTIGDVAAGRGGLPVDKGPIPMLDELATEWLKRRKKTHRTASDDGYRWGKHLKRPFGRCKPGEVDAAAIRRFIERKLSEGLSSTTVLLCVRLLSTFYSDLVERRLADANPVRTLPRSTRRLIRVARDPRTTPFLERLDDVRRVFLALDEPINVAFAIGAFAGLRTGEVLALRWPHVDLRARRIHVRESIKGRLKDDDSRVVPIVDSLYPVLAAWRLRAADLTGRVVPSLHRDGERIDEHTPGRYLRPALEACKVARAPAPTAEDPKATRPLTWYECTRHTFASQWVLGGGSIEMLKEILGHSSVQVTERYAHLRPDLFAPHMLGNLAVDLAAGKGAAVEIGCSLGAAEKSAAERGG